MDNVFRVTDMPQRLITKLDVLADIVYMYLDDDLTFGP